MDDDILPRDLVERLKQFPPARLIPYAPPRIALERARTIARERLERARQRRSVREFSADPVPLELLADLVAIAARAPSGANRQPWRFVIVTNPDVKKQIRVAAEQEERESYDRRMPDEWLAALAPLGVDWRKPFLEIAPALIVMFKREREVVDEGGVLETRKAYYASESCGIAAGFLIDAIHEVGLTTLTHTPSPMGFLSKIIGVSEGEKPFLLLPVGWPAEGCRVPAISRKPLEQVLTVIE
jgi:iodotyrosine deiodinase